MAEKFIMHLDGDAFFVSVEAAKDPKLRGKPVVTGQERGIASALSYEAKKLGITRAMPVFQIRKLFPQVIVVNSDYEAYAVFSKRMMDIVRRYTDIVEEYSIDECFADFSNVAGFAENPQRVLENIKSDIVRELGISVSLGLGPTKVIAKTASKSQKPNGLTLVRPEEIETLLDKTPIGNIWGIGSATSFALRKKGVTTALDLAKKPLPWVIEHFSKPMAEMWHEINGVSVHPVHTEQDAQKSIMKTRTFVPATNDRAYVFSELSKNMENAAKRARETGLAAREFSIYLKTRDFTYRKAWCRLSAPTQSPFDLVREVEKLFSTIFEKGTMYRATGVVLYGLMPAELAQEDLFGPSRRSIASKRILETVDAVNRKYGKSLIHMASSSRAMKRESRNEAQLPGFMPKGYARKLCIPYLGKAR
jgi:DNA polymerase-4